MNDTLLWTLLGHLVCIAQWAAFILVDYAYLGKNKKVRYPCIWAAVLAACVLFVSIRWDLGFFNTASIATNVVYLLLASLLFGGTPNQKLTGSLINGVMCLLTENTVSFLFAWFLGVPTGGGACAGIGSGYYNSKTDITISGNAEVKNAQGGAQGAGIGGGGFGGTGTVTITDNAKVDNATGGEGAAGIGSGVLGDVTVNISGNATVNAEGGANGAGIGGGYASAGDVTIEGGTTVKAEGGVGGGAGIGGGADLEADEDTQNRVTIRSSEDGSPDVTAVGGAPEPGEDGTELSKGGAGIGSGALIEPDEGDREADAIISIEGKVTIKSTAGKDNAAIGANGEEQVIEGLLPGSSIDRRDADGNDISLPGDKQQPADSSEQNSDALEGLTVTDAAGKTLPYTVEWQGSTVVVTAKYPFASLQMTHETLLQLQKQGAQTLRFCTESRTASASVAELLNVSMAGAKIVWSHDGAASALQVNGADHNELLK